MAAQNRRKKGAAILDAILDNMRTALDAGGADTYPALSSELHAPMMDMAHSRIFFRSRGPAAARGKIKAVQNHAPSAKDGAK